MHASFPSRFVLLAAILLSGCSGGNPSANNPIEDSGPADADDGGALGELGGDDDGSTGDPDAAGSDAGLPVGAPCTEDLQCSTFICFRFAAGVEEGFCSSYCFDAMDCPDESWDCVYVRNSGGDITSLCVPEDLCLDDDEDGFGVGPGCGGPDCDDTRDDVNTGADETCDAVDNDCDGNIDDNPIDANLDCDTGYSGPCAEGRTLCLAGFISCEPSRTPVLEACDDIDNDCDGTTDEGDDGAPLSEVCYGGPPGTLGVGACAAGLRTCDGGHLSQCTGQRLPFAELCDGIDNDCDGERDEGNPGGDLPCETGGLGACAGGTTRCDGAELVCDPDNVASDEACDGVDNDCDGSTDEDDGGLALARSCYDGPDGTLDVGLCISGMQTCADGEYGRCLDDVIPEPELCDSLDNDCDGDTDEGNPSGGFVCDTRLLGVCGRGVTECSDAGSSCVPVLSPSDEICDGLDNDCDGQIDEGSDDLPLVRACYGGPAGTEGVGICAGGTQTCAVGDWGGCQSQIMPATMETCDGIDNDCDGTADEDNPGAGVVCTTGLPGSCSAGSTACDASGSIVCVAVRSPSDELCDNVDNDCDGAIDEDADGNALTRACYEGAPGTEGVGACAGGTQTCNDGDFGACVGDLLPATESCDGADNDCNGIPDDGDPGGGATCNSGLPGVCASGTTHCLSGAVSCEPDTASTPELCDGLDNDCDGDTDEDATWADLRAGCTSGLGICMQAGIRVCSGADPAGPTICSATPAEPGTEVCDGLDNDCDGETDEGATWSTLGSVCYAGVGICQTAGVRICDPADASAPPVCSAVASAPDAEVCDGLDNDCDGETDEGATWADLRTGCTSGTGVCLAAGVRVCDPTNPGGATVCSASPTPPQTEVCDGLDNDCDSATDEGALWDNRGLVCTTGLGACQRSGVYGCDAGDPAGALVCSAAPGTPVSELCDGIDNDCDSATDEDFAGLGSACFAGLGACRRAGVALCDPDSPAGPAICDAVPGSSSPETCDLVDNDCDGTVDNGFQSGGAYSLDVACGNCFTNCTTIYAKPNAFGTCNTAGAPTCQMNCNAGYYDLNGVPGDGCEFLLDTGAIYVSASDPSASDGAGCGTGPGATGGGRFPCRSITQGLVQAQAWGRTRVLVASGSYTGTVTLRSGINLMGGYNPVNWSRDWSANPTAIFGNTPTGHRKTVIAQNINSTPTLFEGFAVFGQNAYGAGENSYALWISNCDADLTVRNNNLIAGSGGPGTNGSAGGAGAGGANGSAGSAAYDTFSARCAEECNSGMERAGGSGGSTFCGGTNTSGGSGGRARCPDYQENINECLSCASAGPSAQTRNTDGSAGANGGGGGGIGGCDGLTDEECLGDCACYNPDDPDCPNGLAAVPGSNGSSGGNGAGGAACVSSGGSVSGGEWVGGGGSTGWAGTPGGGGGGGGAGGGVETWPTGACSSSGRTDIGGSGGGGGAGGCGGGAASGGSAGGGSFAIFVSFPFDPGGNIPSVSGNSIQRGFGGDGGDGGNGGVGGAGGRGANGGAGGVSGSSFWCAAGGQKGGEGGSGGHGGGGGGGCGGVSYGIFAWGQGGTSLASWSAGNSFLSGGGGGAGGAGGGSGPGGSSGSTGASGGAGNTNF